MAAQRKRARLHEILAFAAVYVIWGSTYLAIRVGVETLPPLLLAGSRFLLAGTVVYGVLRLRGAPAPTAGHWKRSGLAGIVMLVFGNGLVTWAETRLPSNLAALLVAAVPLYVAGIDWLRPGGVRPPRPVVIGILLGAAGMVLLVRPDPAAAHPTSVLGVLAMLLAGLSWASGSLYARYARQHPHALVAGAQQMLVAGVVLLVGSALRGEVAAFRPEAVSLRSWVAFGYLTVFGSMVAFSAFSWLVTSTSPARVSTTAYVNPVVAVFLGWLILGETLHPAASAGAGLIVCAVIIMVTTRRARPYSTVGVPSRKPVPKKRRIAARAAASSVETKCPSRPAPP